MQTQGGGGTPQPDDTGRHATVRKLPARPRVVRVLVVDDHQTVADLLAVALRYETDIECVGRAATATEGIALVERDQPDVVLMDLSLPDMDGLQATAIITAAHPQMRVILLTAATDPRLVAQAAGAGACAFVPKSAGLEVLLDAIRGARHGAMVVDPAVLTALAELASRPAARRQQQRQVGALTGREQDVLGLLGTGLDVRRVAQRLGISQNTCRGHVKSVLAKLGCHSQLEAVVVATRLGLLDLPVEQAHLPQQALRRTAGEPGFPQAAVGWGSDA
jgi:DNA-binding NarL/FixJ family response regulator